MYRFHINLLADPKESSFAIAWEDAAAHLERLPRMIFEPDGSFVISGKDGQGERWQVDGHLFDFGGRLHRVELHGTAPPTKFDELLKCVGWPAQPVTFELVHEGLTVDEREFRERASA